MVRHHHQPVNIAKLMPPWENALSEAERWDVALYSYTLAYDEALLEAGRANLARALRRMRIAYL